MEKRKWPWKRKCSESESSESLSSHSERDCDEQQEIMKESANDDSQATIKDDEMEESVKILTQKLSACLVNVSAKEELVKQHAKVAEEAVAGWEKAENEVAVLKQQLDVAVQHNLNLEVKTSHLDGALKECVRQLREARDEQEKRTSENSASADPDTLLILEALEKENSSLKQELVARCKELEVVTIERDLSTQAAETASKLQLESVKKVAKLEAECRRLQSIARKSSPLNNLWSEALTESRSDSGSEPGFSDSWASILVSGLDQMKKPSTNLASCSIDIDMMDDFLEMERLAALPETKKETLSLGSAPRESISVDNQLQAELDAMIQRVANLENILENMETEKLELQNALDETMDSLQKAESRIVEAETRLDEVQKELTAASETKESLEFQLVSMEEDSKTISADVDSLKAEIEREKKLSSELTNKCQELSADVDSLKAEIEIERKLSTELTTKCQELETELTRKILETELDQSSNGELKIKQEDLAVAADKLAECQKTIASLGRQLQSLATLEDFLIDTSNIPGFSRDALDSTAGGELWRIPSNETFIPSSDLGHSRISTESLSCLGNGNGDSSRSSSLSPSSTNHGTTAKSRNSFGKFLYISFLMVMMIHLQSALSAASFIKINSEENI